MMGTIGLSEQDLKDAVDHYSHFEALPCEFETSGGKVLGCDDCWELAEKMAILPM